MTARTMLAIGLAALGVVLAAVAGASLVLAQRTAGDGSDPPVLAQLDAAEVPELELDYATLREQGFALFIAKGCPACHANQEAANRGFRGDGVHGVPDLTNLSERFPPQPESLDYLRRWLKSPSSIRPGTTMPHLGLSDEEIDRLLRFLLTEEHFASDKL